MKGGLGVGNDGMSKSEEGLECLNEETFVSDPLSL